MSIHSPDLSGHITITAPGAASISTGPYTIAILYKNIASAGSYVWYAYDSSNFSHLSLYFDGDFWYNFQQWDSNFDISTATWRWLVATKPAGTASVRAHVATYTASGALSWTHNNVTSQPNYSAINRFSIGDEFGNGCRGDLAAFAAFTSEFNDASVEAAFLRKSADILALTPQFFVHWPEAAGVGGAFNDIADGGSENIRTGTWTATADPTNFDFSLGRSGKPKVWDGSSWVQHPAKVWNGSAWAAHSMAGHNGTDFIVAK
jgi:hypothetical protein